MLYPQPVAVEARPGCKIWVKYADGPSGEVDLSDLAGQGPYAAWSDAEFFRGVYIDPETEAITWGNNVEICPDAVYLAVTGRHYKEVFPGMPEPPVIGWLLEGKVGFDDAYPELVEVVAGRGYRIGVRFDDGVSGEIDLSHLVAMGGVFKAWEYRKFFEGVYLADYGVPAWGDGDDVIDLDALQLYMDLTGKTVEELLPGLSKEPEPFPPDA